MNQTPQFTGSMVAIVTPFNQDGTFAQETFELLLERQVQHGTDAIIVCGTTGEAATLSDQEYAQVVGAAVKHIDGRIPVIAGTGGNDTRKTIQTSLHAEELGVDGLLVVAPYYNKPTQTGLRHHFEAVLNAVKKPVILYNVPGRTASNLSASTTFSLSAHERCMGIKEASGDLAQIQEIIHGVPEDFSVLSGDDALSFAIMAHGGHGVVGVAANVYPGLMKTLVQQLLSGDLVQARQSQAKLLPFMQGIFIESNPSPIKAALAYQGLIHDELRLPLVPASAEARAILFDIMDQI